MSTLVREFLADADYSAHVADSYDGTIPTWELDSLIQRGVAIPPPADPDLRNELRDTLWELQYEREGRSLPLLPDTITLGEPAHSLADNWRKIAPYLFTWTALTGLGVFLTEVVGITF